MSMKRPLLQPLLASSRFVASKKESSKKNNANRQYARCPTMTGSLIATQISFHEVSEILADMEPMQYWDGGGFETRKGFHPKLGEIILVINASDGSAILIQVSTSPGPPALTSPRHQHRLKLVSVRPDLNGKATALDAP